MNRAPLATRLAAVEPPYRFDAVLAEVCTITAAMLDDTDAIDVERAFHDYGYSSLAAVEFTRRLSATAGFEIPAVLLFECPTPVAVARYLLSALDADGAGDSGAGQRIPVAARETAGPAEPIAIIGMACRYPGGVATPEDLWRLVHAGTDAITGFPVDRGWDLEALYHPDADHPGTTYVRSGGFLDGIDRFDPEFFQISPREALGMDPQQRLLLEGAWETFENAGVPVASLAGSRTGTFLGSCGSDYAWVAQSARAEVEGYWGTGTAGSVASGRVAYTFGLEGPAITVDTACSSSLVALHLAAGSLRSGECTLALAGGVAVMTTPNMWLEFARHRALSPDGRCRSFSADADGTAWSEGMGLVLLERLSDAQRNGRRILAVLRGSAVNQDGRSNGLTAPRGGAQEAVIRQALANAGLTAADIDVVEAHGTGTPLGDPIEARALLATYGRHRRVDHPLRLGSLKSNIGHTQAAAGVGGIIKMILALRHETLPRTLYAEQPSAAVDWSPGTVSLLGEELAWAPGPRPRRAAISAFGVGGTNAHLILQEPPAVPERPRAHEGPVAWVLSAKTPAALAQRRRDVAEFLSGREELEPGEVAAALAAQDQRLGFRTVCVGDSRGELLAGLSPLSSTSHPRVAQRPPGKVAFVFPGQGSQWQGMAVGLLDSSPVFVRTFHECAVELARYLERPASDFEALVRAGDPQTFERVEVIQPLLFAVLISLATLWRSHGVEPDVVVGHSQGEIAAAYIAGGLSLADAAAVVALRARAIAGLVDGGAMISLAESADAAARRIDRHPGVSIAAVNGPASVVIAGELEALTAILADCEREDVRARRIPVDYASHSVHVEPLKTELTAALSDISPRDGHTRFCSSVTGKLVDTADLDGRYWYRNLRRTVRFESAVSHLIDIGVRTFIEISPHPVLVTAIEEIIEHTPDHDGRGFHVSATVTKHDGDLAAFLRSAAQLYTDGVSVDWRRAYPHTPDRGIELPTHPFVRERYWVHPVRGTVSPESGLSPATHPLLSAAVEPAALPGRRLWTATWSLAEFPWIGDHRVAGAVLVPATAFVELAAYAAAEVGCAEVQELHLEAPLRLPEDGAIALQLWVGEPDAHNRREISIHSRRVTTPEHDHGWQRHAGGLLAPGPDLIDTDVAPLWPPQATAIDTDTLYGALAREGLDYGPAFRNLRSAWSAREQDGETLFAAVELADAQSAIAYTAAHPALLDSAFHIALRDGAADRDPDEVWIPFSWRNIRARRSSGGRRTLRARLHRTGERQVSMTATDEHGTVVLSVGEVALRPIAVSALTDAGRPPVEPFRAVRWVPVTRPAESVNGRWVVIEPDSEFDWEGLDLDRCSEIDQLIDAIDRGESTPPVVLARLGGPADLSPGAIEAALREGLSLLQRWLAEDRLNDSRLVVLTCGATDATAPGSLAGAALWGLIGSAQSEHPDRITLVDLDDPHRTHLLRALVGLGEPKIRVRGATVEVARLFAEPRIAAESFTPDADATILITGGTSGIGAAVARHLVERGARRLVLVSRQGSNTRGAHSLAAELRSAGAHIVVAACDIADRDAMREVIDSISADHALGGVIHSAGVLDDGLITALNPARLATVLRPKVSGTLVLHELTEHLDLKFFVLMSSLAGVIGAAGQGNYAAANSFLDGFARMRHHRGMAATSIAWGLWDAATTMTGHLEGEGVARLAERGLVSLRTPDAMRMFDAALAQPHPSIIAAAIDTGALTAARRAGESMAMFETLLPAQHSVDPTPSADLLEHLATRPDAEWDAVVSQFVRTQIAAVLSFDDDRSPAVDRSFKDLGLDSLGALQLRNRINSGAGLALPVSVVFDHPTVARLARHVTARIRQRDRDDHSGASVTAVADLRRHAQSLTGEGRSRLLLGLTELIRELDADTPAPDLASSIESASESELFEMIDKDLGVR